MARTRRNEVNPIDEMFANLLGASVNCKCAIPANLIQGGVQAVSAAEKQFTPSKILKSGNATIVFWNDGTKTVVRCGVDSTPNDYEAFTAALAIKVFGNNSHLKKMIQRATVEQKPKKKKGEA